MKKMILIVCLMAMTMLLGACASTDYLKETERYVYNAIKMNHKMEIITARGQLDEQSKSDLVKLIREFKVGIKANEDIKTTWIVNGVQKKVHQKNMKLQNILDHYLPLIEHGTITQDQFDQFQVEFSFEIDEINDIDLN